MSMDEKVAESAAYIRGRTSLRPETALVPGSGLGGMGDMLEDLSAIPRRIAGERFSRLLTEIVRRI